MPEMTRRYLAIEGSDYQIVGKKIGCGNFGKVYLGEKVSSKEKCAVKVEIHDAAKKSSVDIRLQHEYEMLKRLYYGYPRGHKINGIPRVYHFGKCGSDDCMVLELLGPNLEDLLELCGQRFSLKTTLMIGLQLLDRIEIVHERGLVYRDIKPENFLLGLKGTKEHNIIHLVDFGLTTYYKDPITNKHIFYRDLKTMTGTARYMSVHSHLGKTQSRRDDLESIGYVLVYFLLGHLPWQGVRAGNLKDKYRKIRDSKMKTPISVLCEGCPVQLETFMKYTKKLAFSETPDYEYLKDLLHSCYEQRGFSYDDTDFDWSKIDLPNDVKRYNKAIKNKNDSRVSSCNTDEASQDFLSPHEQESFCAQKHRKISKTTGHHSGCTHESEKDDTVPDLLLIKKRTVALRSSICQSKWNLKSLSSTEAQCEIMSDMENPSPAVSSNLGTGQSVANQSYYDAGTVRTIESSQRFLEDDFDRKEEEEEEMVVVKPEICEPGAVIRQDNDNCQVCHCEEVVESVMSCLCFSWRRKRNRTCEAHNQQHHTS